MGAMQSLLRASGHLVHKLKARDTTGSWALYWIYVPAAKERLFLKAIKEAGTMNLEAFGTVLASCYGETPTEEVRRMMKETYGFTV